MFTGPFLQSHDKLVFLPKGYKHLFQPVINQVVDYYQPTCIVLQVRKQALVHMYVLVRGCSLKGHFSNALLGGQGWCDPFELLGEVPFAE